MGGEVMPWYTWILIYLALSLLCTGFYVLGAVMARGAAEDRWNVEVRELLAEEEHHAPPD